MKKIKTDKLIKATKTITSFIISFFILFLVTSDTSAANNDLKTIEPETLEEEYERLEREIQQGDAVIKSLEALDDDYLVIDAVNVQSAKLSEQIENIEQQKESIEKEITECETKITETEKQLTILKADIEELNNEINEHIDKYCDRLRVRYIYGDITVFDLLHENNDISSMANNIEFAERLLKQDEELIKNLKTEIDEIEFKKETIAEQKTEFEETKKQLNSATKELSEKEAALREKQKEVSDKSKEINNRLYDKEVFNNINNINKYNYSAGMDYADSKLNEQFSASKSEIDTSAENWKWPVPYENSYISSPYGYRNDPISGAYKFHAGIDITMGGALGKKLIAVKSGIVTKVEYSPSGYGKYLIIDHGDGWASLYGHCNSISVTQGQTITQGQQVATIGSTGYATGPHVHFEIRHNGDKVNPMNYLIRS